MFVDVIVGRVGRAHGVRGAVFVEPVTDEPKRRFAPGATLRVDERTVTVASTRRVSDRLVVTFDDVSDRDAAEALRGATVWASVEEGEHPKDEDEYYDRQLIGCVVVDEDGRRRGTVSFVVHGPAQDILEIETDDATVQVPFVKALVPNVDFDARTLTVVDIGLFSEE